MFLKYPKISIFVFLIVVSYFVFSNEVVERFVFSLGSLKYFGILIAGMMFSFGFTSPFAAGFFIVLHPENIFITGIIGGFGALISDMAIFSFARFSFKDEFEKIRKSRQIKKINEISEKTFGKKIKSYLIYTLAGLFIASPLPDEAGVTILSGIKEINALKLGVISFILNTLGIIVLLFV